MCSLLRYGAVRKKGNFLMIKVCACDKAKVAYLKFNNYIIIIARSAICK